MYRSIYYAVDNLPHDKKIDTRNKTHPVHIQGVADHPYQPNISKTERGRQKYFRIKL